VRYEELIDGVCKFTGLDSRSQASRLLQATSGALSGCLAAPDRARWAHQLPEELRASLVIGTPLPQPRALDVYAAVAQAECVSAGVGTEHAQVAIGVLASVLDAESKELLAQRLPDEFCDLVRDPTRSAGSSPGPRQPRSSARPSGPIATGAPGSVHPISEAQPSTPQTGSVGDWEDARMDHSLGSGAEPGSDESLASGRPGAQRNLGDAKR
jgi:uncharacterized protein (DUF2267 family)